MTVSTTAARHLLVRFTQPARLPEALLAALRDEVVLAGWMRASGVISDIQIRALDPRTNTGSEPRRIDGPMQIIALEGSVGLSGGDVSCGMRIVLARETEAGLETIAGELVEARIEALEVMITAFDDVTATRELDRAGVWVLDATEGTARPAPAVAPTNGGASAGGAGGSAGGSAGGIGASSLPTAQTSPAPANPSPTPARVMPAPMQSGFSEVVRANTPTAAAPAPARAPEPPKPIVAPPMRPSPTFSASNNAMPSRIAKPFVEETEDDPVPEPGDTVEHFAFGQCEVVKSDGDRLHVRLDKDQRIKEIALEMLKVTALPSSEGQTTHHWKLSRKL
jgi:predicted DNA-binding protein with PD1-like motif